MERMGELEHALRRTQKKATESATRVEELEAALKEAMADNQALREAVTSNDHILKMMGIEPPSRQGLTSNSRGRQRRRSAIAGDLQTIKLLQT